MEEVNQRLEQKKRKVATTAENRHLSFARLNDILCVSERVAMEITTLPVPLF